MTASNEMPLEIWADKPKTPFNGDYHLIAWDGKTKYLRATPDKVLIDRAELERVRDVLNRSLTYEGAYNIKLDVKCGLKILETALKGVG